MKRINILLRILAVVSLVIVTGCKKDSENVSKITYYPDITMAGSQEVMLALGTAFTDPGATATENGVQITVNVTVSGDYFSFSGSQVDVTQPNKYLITYSATNKDGFSGSTSRDVYIVNSGDLINNLEGLYTSSIVRNGVPKFQDLQYVMIRKVGGSGNTYEISDGIGGYYDIGRQYGVTYRATGATFTANNIATNDFSFGPSFAVGAFGGSATMVSMTVDPGSKSIKFETDWDQGYVFEVTLTQVNI